ncbi:uncharacterized protein L969DRAFT_15007 [Mixia osmundae IAM 14324]|uniref:DNA replication regulator SLD2 n=1 Tax=Mixia osmundae (strain CBS 9802 / IAM 14324 / JCM 22182 / KY 12970) TaxID=764103 RepID=G7DTK9_MIXOS|nr:uncharacterized protein L969DRAFT_15007 [Mixia osmundae IAM 14324]KEI42807.1 hypothetical protein L969DRAFT_15007 [Mixia osmundae IAM 14324]GAA93856.1 hypothetical protein E5Q_00502 [Mixia osmundae IAM 14324]
MSQTISAATLKAEIKAWEKAFRAQHGRDVDSSDVKSAGMSDKYKQYHKLLKASKLAKASKGAPGKGKARSRERGESADDDPFAAPSQSSQESRKGLMRIRTRPAVESDEEAEPSDPTTAYKTPKRARSGDFVPHLTPSKSAERQNGTAVRTLSPFKRSQAQSGAASQAYHIVRSPSKLQTLISAHSSHAADTPRTRMKRFMAGEQGHTPVKDTARGSRAASVFAPSEPSASQDDPFSATQLAEPASTALVGPSPVKASQNSNFKPLFDLSPEKPAAPAKAAKRPSAKPIFGRDAFAASSSSQSTFVALSYGTSDPSATDTDVSSQNGAEAAKRKGKERSNDTRVVKKKRVDEPELDATPSEVALQDEIEPVRVESWQPWHRFRQQRGHAEKVDGDFSSDEESMPSRARAMSNGGIDHTDREVEVDPAVPSDLVELLSLRASPLKARRQKLIAERDAKISRILQEPSITQRERLARERSGLADLADDTQAPSAYHHDASDPDEIQHDSGQDDDWESEPEGWKDLDRLDDLDYDKDVSSE